MLAFSDCFKNVYCDLLTKIDFLISNVHKNSQQYHKVAKSSLSQLVARFQIFRRLKKEKFDAYVL